MRPIERVVAVGRDHQRRNGRDPACEQPQHVQRGLVGPVDILEHEDGRLSRGELPADRRGDLMRPHLAATDQRFELPADDLGDLEQRSQRARREERVARAPEDAGGLLLVLTEPADERRLADARLARDEDDATARACTGRRQDVRERRQLGRALQQLVGPGRLGRSLLGYDSLDRRRSWTVCGASCKRSPTPPRARARISSAAATRAPYKA